jgi:VWFA-related protein
MRASVRIGAAAGIWALGLAAIGHGQQGAAPQEPPPTFRSGINIVRVDVVVSDREGLNVSDLAAADFEILEDGKPQRIDTFRVIPLDGGRSGDTTPLGISSTDIEADEASRDDVRVFGLFLDDFHVGGDWSDAVREQVTRFLETLGPTDMVGLMDPVSAIGSMRLTRDHGAVIRQVQKFDGRRDDSDGPVDVQLRREYRRPRPVPQARVNASRKALKDFIARLGDLKEGRKTLLLVTQGFSGTSAGDLREIAELANRNNVAIYPIDPQIRPPDLQWRLNNSVGTLRRLAEDTGGREIVDQARTAAEYRERSPFDQPPHSMLAVSLRQITRDEASYYLITYASAQPSDDKFHQIEVRVNRRDVEVRHRKGYWAEGVDALARAAAAKPLKGPTLVETALATVAVDPSPFIRTWIGTGRGENGLTRVTFAWEPLPKTPGSARDSENAASVAITATGAGGVEYFSGSGNRLSFDVPAAPTQLRVTISSARGSVLETDVRRIDVPDFTSPELLFGTPQLYRARTVYELNRIAANPDAVPDAAREFGRGEQLLVRAPVFTPDGSPPDRLQAQLHNRAGRMLAELQLRPGAPASTLETVVPLASLPAGEYGITLSADGPGGSAAEIVVFRVVN